MLKSLELFGFKSFADRTRFDFSRGITCVVGPNGSGKSNVVDAIKWILGDQSPKSLRGKEMTDVIFNGSASRKPAGFAEAVLTFDNSQGLFAVDTTEVQVGRRLYRSGEAEYLINRAPSRLKDVKDLFLGTGAGTSAYSIIEQGRVDTLLQATNVNRRIVFEEAAGVSRFKSRKVDALRKLERVGQNLLRLGDIVQEVHGQLATLRSQAAKAAKFRESTEELRRLRIGLAADDFREATTQLEQSEQEIGELAARLTALETAHHEVEAAQAGVDAELSQAEDRLREVERLAADNREAIASQETTIHHQTARQVELESELERLGRQQQELEARSQEAVGELAEHETALAEAVENLANRRQSVGEGRAALGELEAATAAARAALSQARERQLELLREKSDLGNHTAGFSSRFGAMEANRQKSLDRVDELERQLAGCRIEVATGQKRRDEAAEQLDGLRRDAETWASRNQELAGEQKRLASRLAELREERSGGAARKGVLEDLEQRQEGLSIGARDILARAKENPVPPWNTVVGSVADLLTTDLKHAALLEVALGSRAQLIVVTELAPLVEYVNSGKCRIAGRVGFLPLSGDAGGWVEWALGSVPADGRPGRAVRGADPTVVELDGLPGVVARADRLVKAMSDVPRLAERLLADTWITRTLDAALELARGAGRGARFVTLQGELLESHGTLFAGSVRSETALVSRKSELRALKNDLQRLEREIEAADREAAEHARQVADAEEGLRVAQGRIEKQTGRMAEIRADLDRQQADAERWEREKSAAAREAERLAEEQRQLETNAEDERSALTAVEQAIQELQVNLSVAEGRVKSLEQGFAVRQGELAAAELDLVKQEQNLKHRQEARSRLDQERLQRDLQRDEAERRVQVVLARREQIERHLAEAQAELAVLSGRRGELEGQAAGLLEEREAVRRNRQNLAERELELRHERRELKERHHDRELQTRTIRQKLEHLIERIREEFHCELAEAVANGATALHAGEEPTVAEEPDGGPVGETGGQFIELPAVSDDMSARRVEIESRIDRLRKRLKQMGHVNTDSLKDLDELETRHARLNGQLVDLQEAKGSLEEIVRRINAESKRLFLATFEQVREHFQLLFRKLFGGGDGDVVLEDPEDVLECGIDIVARPPGKELRSISLLSGGEKTLTAVALLLAIFQSKPSPFCILDEVDAALDEANVERYMRVIQAFQETTQFIVITHSKRTMTVADVLYGVTMEESGVSKRMSVRFEDVGEDGHFRTDAA